jgi:Domain of unknown function (DUF3067)
MTATEFHKLLLAKWGKSYDIQLRKTQGKIFLQIMWKYLEQNSFGFSQTEYITHLEEIVNYLNGWGVTTQIQKYILDTKERPRVGKAVSIPLDLGERAREWILQER